MFKIVFNYLDSLGRPTYTCNTCGKTKKVMFEYAASYTERYVCYECQKNHLALMARQPLVNEILEPCQTKEQENICVEAEKKIEKESSE